MEHNAVEHNIVELVEALAKSQPQVLDLKSSLEKLTREQLAAPSADKETPHETKLHTHLHGFLRSFGSPILELRRRRTDSIHRLREEASEQIGRMNEELAVIPHGATKDNLAELLAGTEDTIASLTLQGCLEAVEMDVILYKLEVYKVFLGLSDKWAYEFVDRKHFRLSQGYQDQERRVDRQALGALEQAFGHFYDAGIEAVYCFRKKGKEDCAFDALVRMESASMDALARLDAFAENQAQPRPLPEVR